MATPAQIVQTVLPRVLKNMTATRIALDDNATLPVSFSSLVKDMDTVFAAPGLDMVLRAALHRTNLLPAAITRNDYMDAYRARYPTDDSGQGWHCWYNGDTTIGFAATDFIKRHKSLWWDSDQGTATVKALAKVVTGDLAGIYPKCPSVVRPEMSSMAGKFYGELNKPTPPWLTATLQSLGAGEDWILKLNMTRIVGSNGVIADARTWLPEATWFGWDPTHIQFPSGWTNDIRAYSPQTGIPPVNFRTSANAALTTLSNRVQAITAAQAQVLGLAAGEKMAAADAKLGNGVPRIPPPGDLPSWQKVVVMLAVAGGGLAGLSWYRNRGKTLQK